MEVVAKKKRNSTKKSPNAKTKPTELPPNVPKHPNIENFLLHPLSRQWIAYEWTYDEVEDAFFNKSKTYAGIYSSQFPRLKTRYLTTAEWRKIRKLSHGHKIRRFSSKFVQEQRIELEKFRQRCNILRDNQQIHQLTKMAPLCENVDTSYNNSFDSKDYAEFEIYSLIVETKRLLATKNSIVTELRGINNAKAGAQDQMYEKSNENADKAIAKLRNCNENIVSKWNKLMAFQVVKDALLFDALDKKKLLKPLSPFYFRRKCEIQIYENHQAFNSKAFISSNAVETLLNIMLELALAIIKHEQLAVNAGDFLNSLIKEQLDLLERIMTTENIEYLQIDCVPLLFTILKKVCI